MCLAKLFYHCLKLFKYVLAFVDYLFVCLYVEYVYNVFLYVLVCLFFLFSTF